MLTSEDNSGSMEFEEGGERKKDLQVILSRVAYAASLFDDDGIQVRFMNQAGPRIDPNQLNNIRTEEQAERLAMDAKYSGLTPLGTQLRSQIVEPLVLQQARSGRLRKPVLIITITDGQPAGESRDTLEQTIMFAERELSRMPQYGKHACSYQFAQVGNDQAAKAFLADLDSKREIGDLVDCTSSTIILNPSPQYCANPNILQISKMSKKKCHAQTRQLTSHPNSGS